VSERVETEAELKRSTVVRLAWRLDQYYIGGYHDIRLNTPCTLPDTGPAILVCNHISGLDPTVLQAISHRLITWMMAKEYFDVRAMRWFYEAVRAIPVARSGRDLAATRSALRVLERGRVLGIFPEGRIDESGSILPFQTGVAMIAIKADVPVIPAFIDGSMHGANMLEAFLYPQRGLVAFGPAVVFDRSDTSRATIDIATEAIRRTVVKLAQRSTHFSKSRCPDTLEAGQSIGTG
jgi:1-acyl-sn-glycerol-3-phosphate acyltransferase